MDKLKYHEKCLMILENENFIKLDRNPTNKTEEKIQRILRKMKKKKNHNKSTYLYIQVDFVPASSMEQLKYTKYLKITQLMNSNTANCFEHWNCKKRFGKVLSKAFVSASPDGIHNKIHKTIYRANSYETST